MKYYAIKDKNYLLCKKAIHRNWVVQSPKLGPSGEGGGGGGYSVFQVIF